MSNDGQWSPRGNFLMKIFQCELSEFSCCLGNTADELSGQSAPRDHLTAWEQAFVWHMLSCFYFVCVCFHYCLLADQREVIPSETERSQIIIPSEEVPGRAKLSLRCVCVCVWRVMQWLIFCELPKKKTPSLQKQELLHTEGWISKILWTRTHYQIKEVPLNTYTLPDQRGSSGAAWWGFCWFYLHMYHLMGVLSVGSACTCTIIWAQVCALCTQSEELLHIEELIKNHVEEGLEVRHTMHTFFFVCVSTSYRPWWLGKMLVDHIYMIPHDLANQIKSNQTLFVRRISVKESISIFYHEYLLF